MDRFEQVYRQYIGPLFAYCRRALGSEEEARDVVQETFLRLYRHMEAVPSGEENHWLFAVARNLCINLWKKRQVEKEHRTEISRPSAPASAPDFAATELAEIFRKCARLKDIHKRCLLMHYVLGMSLDEIAATVALTAVQVKGHLQYGLKILRAEIGLRKE